MNFLNIINQHYPNCAGAILTGSALNTNYNKAISDIDIVVFDTIFSVISPLILYQNGYKIDFTQIPINNIDQILRNEQFDQRGILITMIAEGNIIKDDHAQIINQIKLKSIELFNKGVHDNMPTYKALLKGLSKLRKEFDKEVKQYQRYFLINEFFSTVTQIELIKTSNWRFSGKHKANLLFELNEPFVNEILELVTSSNKEKDYHYFKKIGSYIDEYLNFKVTLRENRHFNESYHFLDLDYKGINIKHFVSFVLPEIISTLGNNYIYFFLSPFSQHRIYRNRLCICFKKSHELDIDELLKAIDLIFSSNLKIEYRFTMTPTFALNESTPNNNFVEKFEKCAIEASLLAKRLVIDFDSFDAKRNLMISLILNSFLLSYLGINKEDTIQLLYYLSSRYLINRQEQEHKNPQQLNELKIKKYKSYSRYFQENKDDFIKAIDKGKSLLTIDFYNDEKLYTPIIIKLKDFLNIYNMRDEGLIQYNNLTYKIISSCLKEPEPYNCLLFTLIFENLQQLLLLNSDQTALQITILSEAMYRE